MDRVLTTACASYPNFAGTYMEICGDERAVGVEPSAPPLKNSEPPPDKGYLKKFKFFNFVFFPLQSCHRRSLFSQGRTETILFFFWGGFLSLRSWHKLLPFLASPLPNFSRSNVLSFQRSPVPTFSRFKSPPPPPKAPATQAKDSSTDFSIYRPCQWTIFAQN